MQAVADFTETSQSLKTAGAWKRQDCGTYEIYAWNSNYTTTTPKTKHCNPMTVGGLMTDVDLQAVYVLFMNTSDSWEDWDTFSSNFAKYQKSLIRLLGGWKSL